MSDQTTLSTNRTYSLPILIVLGTLGLYISLMLMTRANERTMQRTQRISSPEHVKRGLAQIQGYKCMFCRVRRKLPNFQIDHVTPVVRGGSNKTANLQLLCVPCKQRKSIQTNEEVHTLYRKALQGVTPGRPPRTPIPRARLREAKGGTMAHDQVRKFKRTKHISHQAKIRSGNLGAGAACGVAWFFAWNLSFTDPSSLVGNISVFGALASDIRTGAGHSLNSTSILSN